MGPSGNRASVAAAEPGGTGTAAVGTVFTRPAVPPGGSAAGQLWAFAGAASAGAFAALAGVAFGWALARSATRRR